GCRLTCGPVKTPPAAWCGAPARGRPSGSTTDSTPAPSSPVGALANHGRPKALFREMPRGAATGASAPVTACGLLNRFTQGGLLAVKRSTQPSSAAACPSSLANAGG